GINFTNGRDELWYLKAPNSGSNTITISITGGSPAVIAGATTYYNVDPTAPLSGITNSGSGTTQSVTVTTNTTQLAVDALALATNVTPTVGAGQTQEWDLGNSIQGASSDQ